ncbi:MAG TPA: hypothetical protein VFE19_12235 [Jatrophihabitantaceae bacterium]|jgi:hypothetical protein|nr:hypothetical protein [Jatrophihabitantaceae bacterium]
MLTAPAGGGALAVLGALEPALVLVCGGRGDELTDDGALALELCVLLVGADGVRDAEWLPDGERCGVGRAEVRGVPRAPVGCPPELREDD